MGQTQPKYHLSGYTAAQNYLCIQSDMDGSDARRNLDFDCHILQLKIFEYKWWPLERPFFDVDEKTYAFLASDFLGRRTAWMLGSTPPCAMVTPLRSLFNSSSFLIASWDDPGYFRCKIG